MLFGRKTPPAGAPKADGADAARQAPVPNQAPPQAPAQSSGQAPGLAAHAPTSASPLGTLPGAVPAAPSPMRTMPGEPFSDSSSERSSDKGSAMNTSMPKPPTTPAAGMKTDIPRRVVDVPGAVPRGAAAPAATPAAAAAPAPATPATEQRRLIVGRDISLSGEIGSCDVLVVEGTVEAKLRDGRNIEIADGGLFKGSVEIDQADIGGRFEGELSVRGRLTVRATGKITGSIKYGELAVEAGGQLVGDIQILGAAKPAAAAPAATPAAEPALAAATAS
ncbi:hypothetical protein DEW08_07495 [Azospirillum thermophilum]|uniref:Cell shape determination protein CcmA n=2 Tax=Azospirillum thermophilum TaxID=2202148 RepID=A0A2S2CNL1_9PROT|nr:hypothetical protein DEW08_07495 [Azospirillum thermophilum]